MITWDETKRKANVEKHGLDFVGAEAMFDYDTVAYEDVSAAYGEQRINVIGFLNGQIVHLTYTDLSTDTEEILRLISLRKATTHETNWYIKETAP